MDPLTLLERIYDWAAGHKGAAWTLFLIATSLTASVADLLSVGSVVIPDDSLQRRATVELFSLLDKTQAQRAMLGKFDSGDRVAVAAVEASGAAPVPPANRRVSLDQAHYNAMHQATLRGQCWHYKTQHNNDGTALEAGMVRVGAEILVSCPVYNGPSKVAWGVVKVSWDSPLIEKQAAIDVVRAYGKSLSDIVAD